MSFRVKYQLIEQTKSPIKAISLSKSNLLALASGQETDWLHLLRLHSNYSLAEIPMPNVDKRPISLLQWSPKSDILATSYERLTISEFKDGALQTTRTFNRHTLEITAISWSSDGTKIATTSLDGQLIINDIESGKEAHTMACNTKTVGVSWDPYDKYVACLRFDNTVVFYRTQDWEAEITINLGLQQKDSTKYSSKRDDRKLDWSVDCRYLLVPNLDDRSIPTVACLDRNQGFQVSKTFIGPFSSINVVKFSPVMYKSDAEKFNVFGMGDNDGNLSIWKLGDEKAQDPNPVTLLKGHKNSGELVEDITWNSTGTLMIACTSKKYLILLDLQNTFGDIVTKSEKQERLKELYGNTKNQMKSLKIFVPRHFPTKKYEEELVHEKQSAREPLPVVQEQVVHTQFKTIIENGKKKVIPILKQDQEVNGKSQQPVAATVQPNAPILLINQAGIMAQNYVYQLNYQQRSLHLDVQKQATRLFNQPTYGTMIRCLQGSEVNWVDYVEGQVKIIQQAKDYIIIYTDQNLLYIENHLGIRQEAPLVIPFLSQLCVNQVNQVMCLQNNGDFKIIDIDRRSIVLEGDIRILMKSVYEWMERKQLLTDAEKEGKQAVDPLIKAHLKVDQDGYPLPEFLFKDFQVYSYNKHYRQWVRTRQFESNPQDKRSNQEQMQMFNFNSFQIPQPNESVLYNRLICQTSMQDAVGEIQQIAKLEEQLIQYYVNEDINGYVGAIYIYIRKLCDSLPLNYEKLRNVIFRYLEDANSKERRYLESKLNLSEFQDKVLFIVQQYPRALPIVEFLLA